MENRGLINLRYAVNHGELKEYLVSYPDYVTHSQNGINVMNDFVDITYSLNKYGFENPGFDKIIHDTMLDILSEKKVFSTYSLANIINEQLNFEKRGSNLIKFIDEQLLVALKESINTHKSMLSTIFDFEGSYFKTGLLGVYENMDKNVYSNSGRHIL